MKLTLDLLEDMKVKDSALPGQYAEEASTLGLAPGEWPDFIPVEAWGRTIQLRPIKHETREGDLLYVIYSSQGDGMIELKIFND